MAPKKKKTPAVKQAVKQAANQATKQAAKQPTKKPSAVSSAKKKTAKRSAPKAKKKPAQAATPDPTPAPENDANSSAQNGASRGGMFSGLGGGLHMGESENYIDFLSRVFEDMGGDPLSSQRVDGMTQSMSLVLGSGPAFAALESMMANTTAQSAVLMNAVQTQRQLDQVGLCCTSACVKQLLNMNNGQDTD